MSQDNQLTDNDIRVLFERRAERAYPGELRASILKATARSQRRTPWRIVTPPWRSLDVFTTARLAVAAAGVLIVAALAVALLGRPADVARPGGDPGRPDAPIPSPAGALDTPTAVTTPTPTPPLPSPAMTLTAGQPQSHEEIPPGRYPLLTPGGASTGIGGWPSTVIVSIPEGWIQNRAYTGGGLYSDDSKPFGAGGATLSGWAVEQVAAGLCGNSWKPTGPTVNDLVAALATIPGLEITDQSDVSLAGFSGKKLVIGVTADPGCDRDWISEPLRLWTSGRFADDLWTMDSSPGWKHELWILDVDGKRFVLDGAHAPDAPPERVADLQAMVESIEIEP